MISQAYIFPVLHSTAQVGFKRSVFYTNAKEKSNIASFINFICEEKGISLSDFFSDIRLRDFVECRQWVCYYYTIYCETRKLPKLTLKKMGRALGDKHHTSILHSVRAMQNIIDTDQELADHYNNLFLKYTTA